MSQRTANAIARYAVAVAALLVLLVIAQPAEARYSDGMNMYEYVQTNPIRYRDPMGQLLEEDPPQHVAPADEGGTKKASKDPWRAGRSLGLCVGRKQRKSYERCKRLWRRPGLSAAPTGKLQVK